MRPTDAGDWQVRVVLAVRGVVVHVEHVTVVVGESEAESSARTTFRLVDDLSSPEALRGSRDPDARALCQRGDGMHGFSFLLADDEGIEAAQVYLPSGPVTAFIDARQGSAGRGHLGDARALRAERGHVVLVELGRVRDPSDVAGHLIALARTGRPVWEDLQTALDQIPTFADRLRETLKPRGFVQLAVEQDTIQILPVQFLVRLPAAHHRTRRRPERLRRDEGLADRACQRRSPRCRRTAVRRRSLPAGRRRLTRVHRRVLGLPAPSQQRHGERDSAQCGVRRLRRPERAGRRAASTPIGHPRRAAPRCPAAGSSTPGTRRQAR